MLRISRVKENQSRITLKVEGRLVSDWVTLLEKECAEISVLGNPLSLDLGDVSFVDRTGERLLQRLFKTYPVSRCSSFILQLLQQPERES